jgi:hypothetical protein
LCSARWPGLQGFLHEALGDDEQRWILHLRTADLIDVTGDAAVAKATLNYGAVVIDYFLLPKNHDKWKIANKVYGRKS